MTGPGILRSYITQIVHQLQVLKDLLKYMCMYIRGTYCRLEGKIGTSSHSSVHGSLCFDSMFVDYL